MNNKQNKTEVVVEKYFYGEIFYCPSCGRRLGASHNDLSDVNYCQKCGQALDWNSATKE